MNSNFKNKEEMNKKIKNKHEMNKLNNNHYIMVSIQFSFWCNFIQIIIYHFGIIIKTGFLDSMLS